MGVECAAEFQGEEGWKCMFGQYRLPTLKTPYLLVASQYDSYQLGNNVGHKPGNDQEKAYAENFAKATRDLVQAVNASSTRTAVFSWACYNHCVSTSHSGFDRHTCDTGVTMHRALNQFLDSQTGASSLHWIDSCTTFACGKGCNIWDESIVSV